MTREEIMSMAPGREMDRLVAEKVMNLCVLDHVEQYGDGCVVSDEGWEEWTRHPECGRIDDPEFLLPYSTDIAAAWEVVEKMKTREIKFCVRTGIVWQCEIKGWTVFSESAPVAICKAALLTVTEG